MPPAGIFFGQKKESAVEQAVIRVTREDWADATVDLPGYATAGAAGADVRANFSVGAACWRACA